MRSVWLAWLAEQTGWAWLKSLPLSQTLFVAVGFLVTLLIAMGLLRRAGLSQRLGLFAVFAAGSGALLLGRWIDLAFRGVDLAEDPFAPFIIVRGGFSSLGAYTGAVIATALFLRWRREPVWPWLDAFAPGMLFGAALARTGCLFNGCDFGRISGVTSWSLRYPRGTAAFTWLEDQGLVGSYHRVGLPMHPFPLYEAAPALLLGALVLLRPGLFGSAPGQRASGVAVAYLGVRLVAEHFRANVPMLTPWLTVMQGLALVGIAIFGALWWRARRRSPSTAQSTVRERESSTLLGDGVGHA